MQRLQGLRGPGAKCLGDRGPARRTAPTEEAPRVAAPAAALVALARAGSASGDVSLLEESYWEDAGRKSPPAASGVGGPQQMDAPTPSYWERAEDWQQRLMPHWQKRGAVVAEEEEFVVLNQGPDANSRGPAWYSARAPWIL